MSWVSQANIKTIMTAIRNKFTTSDLVIANDAKDTGVELNYASQDGLVTVSPISTSASTEAALHLSNGDDTKKTELTQGTLSYVTGTGSSETYNYMSLLGNGVTFGKNGGGNVQLGGVADPTSAQQVATKNYADNIIKTYSRTNTLSGDVVVPAQSFKFLYQETGFLLPDGYSTIATHVSGNDIDLLCIMFITTYIDTTNNKYMHNTIVYNTSTSDITIPSGTKINYSISYRKK